MPAIAGACPKDIDVTQTRRLFATLSVALLLPACGNAATSSRSQPTASAKPFTLVGLSIDEPLPQAEAALRAQGYEVSERHDGMSFEQVVTKAVDEATGVPVPYMAGDGNSMIDAQKGGEQVMLMVYPSPEGGRLSYVAVKVPLAGRTADELYAETVQRYGKPTTTNAFHTSLWCAAGDACKFMNQAQLPYLKAATESGAMEAWSITLQGGQRSNAAQKALVDAAVRAKVGKVKPSF